MWVDGDALENAARAHVDDASEKATTRGFAPKRAGNRSRAHPPSTGRDHVTASAVPKYATAAARAARAASTDSIVSRLLCLTRRPVSRAFYFWDAPKCVLRASGHLSKFSDHDSSKHLLDGTLLYCASRNSSALTAKKIVPRT